MTQIDVNTFLGAYPFRNIGEWGPAALVREMARVGTTAAWVSHLGAVYRRDPAEGNAVLYAAAALDPRLRPVRLGHDLPGRRIRSQLCAGCLRSTTRCGNSLPRVQLGSFR